MCHFIHSIVHVLLFFSWFFCPHYLTYQTLNLSSAQYLLLLVLCCKASCPNSCCPAGFTLQTFAFFFSSVVFLAEQLYLSQIKLTPTAMSCLLKLQRILRVSSRPELIKSIDCFLHFHSASVPFLLPHSFLSYNTPKDFSSAFLL